jgi:hypothetical protein
VALYGPGLRNLFACFILACRLDPNKMNLRCI